MAKKKRARKHQNSRSWNSYNFYTTEIDRMEIGPTFLFRFSTIKNKIFTQEDSRFSHPRRDGSEGGIPAKEKPNAPVPPESPESPESPENPESPASELKEFVRYENYFDIRKFFHNTYVRKKPKPGQEKEVTYEYPTQQGIRLKYCDLVEIYKIMVNLIESDFEEAGFNGIEVYTFPIPVRSDIYGVITIKNFVDKQKIIHPLVDFRHYISRSRTGYEGFSKAGFCVYGDAIQVFIEKLHGIVSKFENDPEFDIPDCNRKVIWRLNGKRG